MSEVKLKVGKIIYGTLPNCRDPLATLQK